ncbi:MAG: hypothetical protein RMJ89_09005 [Flammeovirgaceae bacterium]|nr:hypothetical protein [Flammeovirgaceae bacterium]
MITVLFAIGVFAIFFSFLALRMILKGGEFRGTCASQSPFLNKEGVTCNYCGKPVGSCDTASAEKEQ